MNDDTYPRWLLSLDQSLTAEIVGNKALNLALLKQRGLTVPTALVIPCFHRDRLNMSSVAEFLCAIDDLGELLPKVLPSQSGWAVRSSATIEDLAERSLAGRFDTKFIKMPADLAAAVQQVWQSGQVAQIGPEAMAVVVQQCVEADFSGVAFSRDPSSASLTTVVEICRGSGAALVGGEVTPWTIRVDEVTELPPGFSPQTLKEIDQTIQRLAKEMRFALDMEWAVRDGQLYWLQMRPLTGGPPPIDFTIPQHQQQDLSGLWMRMEHCFAPQAPLVVSMDPGGYFRFPLWESQLVNQFHYIRMKPRAKIQLREHEFDAILDQWDETEQDYTRLFDEMLRTPLSDLGDLELWDNLHERIHLKREFFAKYYDLEFFHIREQSKKSVVKMVSSVCTKESVDTVINQLLEQLDTLTDRKQRTLLELVKMTRENPAGDIRSTSRWREFMDLFGFESANTQLFYLPMLKENPEWVIEMVNQLAENQVAGNEVSVKHGIGWREQADLVHGKLPENDAALFMSHLLRLRRCMKRTEDDDYLLQKATAQVRELLLEIGRRLNERGRLGQADDVFFLEQAELKRELSQPPSQRVDLRPCIQMRRKEFDESSLLTPPAMIVNGRTVHPKTSTQEENVLRGTAASPGLASGNAFVLHDLTLDKNPPSGAVLVAPTLTPALAYTLIGCAGVITEIGGLTSHGAIVAREMGVPAVVGVNGVRQRLVTGMPVSVDGTRGEIHIH